MDWFVKNAADLIGHTIVILVFFGGFLKLHRQSKLDRDKDIAIKQHDRTADCIQRCTSLVELIRIRLYKLGISPFNRNAPLDSDTDARLKEIEQLRSDLFGHAIFIPPELARLLDAVIMSFDSFTPAIQSDNIAEVEWANDASSQAISAWRISATKWHQGEWQKLQS